MKFSFLFLYIFPSFEWYNVVPRRVVWWQSGRTTAPRPLLAHRNTLCSPHVFFYSRWLFLPKLVILWFQKYLYFCNNKKNHIIYLILFLFSPSMHCRGAFYNPSGNLFFYRLNELMWFFENNNIRSGAIHTFKPNQIKNHSFIFSTQIILRVSECFVCFSKMICFDFPCP